MEVRGVLGNLKDKTKKKKEVKRELGFEYSKTIEQQIGIGFLPNLGGETLQVTLLIFEV